MSTPTTFRQTAQTSAAAASRPGPLALNAEWRCTRCNKMLGVCRDDRMHLRFTRGHEYLVGFPVQAICRSCGTLNQAVSPKR